jgi:arylsulfatase A-like enzyme
VPAVILREKPTGSTSNLPAGCHEQIKNRGNYFPTTAETGTRDSFDAYEYPWANASNTPFRMFKHWVHEGGISTPFIACYPAKIKSGVLIDQPGHIIDIMPTLLDFAGGKYPATFNGNEIQSMEGISLVPALKGKKLERKTPLFWEHEGNRAMRSGDWKLVSAYDYSARKFKAWELYNIADDRSELVDLGDQNPGIRQNMIDQYEEWCERVRVVPKEIIDERK